MGCMRFSRVDVLRFRVRAQELQRDDGGSDEAVLDLGVQDTGPDGAAWALAVRGASVPVEDLALAWTLRGAPHFYRRAEIAAVAAATAPWSDTDAAKRIFDAAESTGGVEFYLIEQERPGAITELEMARKCLENYRKLRST